MKNLLIINPVSGGKRGNKLRERLLSAIKANSYNVDIKYSEYRRHSTHLAKEHAPDYDNIFISGGDGSVHEVLNGLPKEKSFKIGIFPIGTGNDFFYSLNMKNDIEFLVDYYFTEKKKKSKYFDLFEAVMEDDKGKIEKKAIVNVFGIGFDAFVAFNMNGFRMLPGVSAYVAAVFKSLVKLDYVDISLKINNETTITGSKLLISFGNSKRSGGGFYLNPFAEIDDKQLDIGIIEKISKMKIIKTLPLALVNKLHNVPEISFHKMFDCTIELKKPYYVHADGEILSDSLIRAKIHKLEHNFEIFF